MEVYGFVGFVIIILGFLISFIAYLLIIAFGLDTTTSFSIILVFGAFLSLLAIILSFYSKTDKFDYSDEILVGNSEVLFIENSIDNENKNK